MKPFLTVALFGLISVVGLNLLGDGHFAADVTHGNIRCVLMSVGQTTVFPNEQDTFNGIHVWDDRGHGVRCLTVIYLLERLDATSLEQVHASSLEFLAANNPLNIEGHGSYRKIFDYNAFQNFLDFTLPKVSDPKQAIIMQDVRFGAVPNLKPFDLVIEVQLGNEVEKFNFNSIRLQ